MRTLGYYRDAKRIARNLDAESTRLLQAFSDGVNSYMNKNSEKLLYLFKETGLEPESWTPADCIASWWQTSRFFAGNGLRDLKGYGTSGRDNKREITRDDTGAVVKKEFVSDEWIKQTAEFAEQYGHIKEEKAGESGPKFSHAWVVGGDKSSTGSSTLCSMPQTPVRNPSLLYEFHIIGRSFNARGIGFPGSPIILIGFNEHVAWGMTALGADQADLFVLKTSPEHSNQYYFDEEWKEMTIRTETIKIKGQESITLTINETHLGPVVTGLAMFNQKGLEVARKAVPHCDTNTETIQAGVAMMRSKDVNDFSEAITKWRYPTANCVFGDSKGNIGYWTVGAFPIRSRHSINNGQVAHTGTDSKYDWQGFIPYDMLPHVINPPTGYLASANNLPIQSFYKIAIGTGIAGDTMRSWRLEQLLGSKGKFTPDDVLSIHDDQVDPVKMSIVKTGYYIRDELGGWLSDNAGKALDYLEQWYQRGCRMDSDIKGTELAGFISLDRRLLRDLAGITGGQPGMCLFSKRILNKVDSERPARLSPEEIQIVDTVLSNAWSANNNRRGRGGEQGKLDYFNSLDGLPSLDREKSVTGIKLNCTDQNTLQSQDGQAYVQLVPLHNPDTAKSMLPPGQSEHPDSPYRTTCLELWQNSELHPAPLSRKAVEQISDKQLRLGR